MNALTVNDKADADAKDTSVWHAHIKKGSERLPLEGIRAFKAPKGGGKFRFQMRRVVFGASIKVNVGMTVATFDLEMELDIGGGSSESVTVTFTKQPA